MCYPPPRDGVRMLGVYTAPIGDAFVQLSNELGIMSVWRDGGEWRGSSDTVSIGLVDPETI